MRTTSFSLDAYFARIDYARAASVSAETLDSLQRAQLAAIPFENFDVLLGRGISLDPGAICAKLLVRRRGGYCFELNGLFRMALAAIGFDARPQLAWVHTRGRPERRTHEVVLVSIAGRPWLADAGFGGPGLRAPIPLECGVIRHQGGVAFRLVDAGSFGTMLQGALDGQWRDIYSVDPDRASAADIAAANRYTSTDRRSQFTSARIAALQTPRGRITLLNRILKKLDGDQLHTVMLSDGPAYCDALEAHFGIALGDACAALPPMHPDTPKTLENGPRR